MADWEEAPMKVTDRNIRQFADTSNLYVPKDTFSEDEMKQELAQLEIKHLESQGWEAAPSGAPAGHSSTSFDLSGWEEAPAKKGSSLKDKLVGAGETAGSMLSSAVGMVAGGLAGIPAAAIGGSESGANTVKKVTDALTYQPRSDKGKEYMNDVGSFLESGIEKATPWMESAIKGIPLVGDQISDEQRAALSRGASEVGANFIPLEGVGALKRFKKTNPAAEAAARRIQERVEPTVEASPGTLATADDFAAFNPYDVGGHVSEAQAGRQTVLDSQQGDLFGSQTLEMPPETPRGDLDVTGGLTADEPMGSLRNRNEPSSYIGEPVPYDPTTPPELYRGRGGVVDHGETFEQWKARHEDVTNPEAQAAQYNLYRQERDFPANTEMADAMKAAEENAAYKQYEAQQKTLKEAAFKEIESLKERRLVEMENQRQLEIARQAGQLDLLELQREGDKSVMSPRATEFLSDAIRSGSLKTALDTIGSMHDNAMYRTLAKYLGDKLDGIKARFHDTPIMQAGDRAYTGYFDAGKNEVGFSRHGAISPHTVLHETTHALTSHFLRVNPAHFLSRGMRNIYEQVKGRRGFEQFKHIVNEREHLAEAFSNPEYQSWLKKQFVSPQGVLRTAWDKFVNVVRNMLGIKDREMANALAHTIDIGKRIVDQSPEKFRNNAKEQLRGVGLNKKLIDLMATERPRPVGEEPRMIEPYKKLPALGHAVEDFAFFQKTPEEIIQLAQSHDDIPKGVVEKAAQQLQAGGLFESLKTRNPVVKYTYERVTRAFQEANERVQTELLDRNRGLKEHMRDLSIFEKAEIWLEMMLHEGQELLTGDQLARMGYNEKQIALYQRYHELGEQFFHELNARRAAMGLKPIDKRIAHIAGLFAGDFSRMVFKEVVNPGTGKVTQKIVGRVAGNTKWEMRRAEKWMREQYPEYTFGPIDYHHLGKRTPDGRKMGNTAADRFAGLMEAINFIEKSDSDFKAVMDSYRDYVRSDAVNFLNATRTAKAKVKEAGGILGSEGNKAWESHEKNAIEGMKAQLAYFEQGYSWMAMQKAVEDISKVTSDESVATRMPNAVKWSSAYVDHALGRKPGFLTDAANGVLNVVGQGLGVGHTNFTKMSNKVKHLMMQKFMGFYNFPFTVTQLMQPVQVHPAMLTLLKQRGLDLSVATSQVKATSTYLASLHPSLKERASAFDRQAIDYANKYGIFDVKLSDHTNDINSSPIKENFDRYVGDLNISAPEHLTRGTSFFFYSHLLKEAGIPAKDIFSAAENLTNFTMTNYHFAERPLVYNHLGWIGDIASTLTRYKHNQLSQTAFYAREGVRGMREGNLTAGAPLAVFLGAALAFGGIVGFFGYNEVDALYTKLSEHVLKKPDTLTNVLMTYDVPEVLTHGIFSMLGLDMSSRFSHANTIPDSIPGAIMPYGSALLDMAKAGYGVATDPLNEIAQKRAAKSFAPQSVQGQLENDLFTKKIGPDKNLYLNPRDLQGRAMRTDKEVQMRGFPWGMRSLRESKELAGNYSDSVIRQGNANIRDDIMANAEELYTSGQLTSEKARELAKKYVEHEGTGFGQSLSTFAKNQRLTQLQRQMINGSIFDKKRAAVRANAAK